MKEGSKDEINDGESTLGSQRHLTILKDTVTPYPKGLELHIRMMLQNISVTRLLFIAHVPKVTCFYSPDFSISTL